jgi:hypothetical protein
MKTKINQEKRHPMQESPKQNPAKLKDLHGTQQGNKQIHECACIQSNNEIL